MFDTKLERVTVKLDWNSLSKVTHLLSSLFRPVILQKEVLPQLVECMEDKHHHTTTYILPYTTARLQGALKGTLKEDA